jgi:hypothetical protein
MLRRTLQGPVLVAYVQYNTLAMLRRTLQGPVLVAYVQYRPLLYRWLVSL